MKKRYKFLSAVLCVAMLFLSLTATAFAEDTAVDETDVILGDMDLSGKVDTADARLILKLSAGICEITEEHLALGDMNADGIISVEDAVLALKQAVSVGGVVIPSPNGENYLSDDPNNEFIQLIANTYNLPTASLVAIYSVPDSGTNYVLEFKGSGILGNSPPYEKSVDNLKTVYQIGIAPERKIAYTDGAIRHHNCTSGEGILVFNLVQTMVMEQYPDYFEGTGK